MAGFDYIGKICPVCHEEIKQGERVVICPSCEIPHHSNCWESNKGCSTFGCAQQGVVKTEEKANQNNSLKTQYQTLVACSDCGKLISYKADVCVYCGAPTGKEEKRVTKITTCEVFLRVIAGLIWFFGFIAGIALSIVEVQGFYHTYTEFSWTLAISYWFVAFITGIFIMG